MIRNPILPGFNPDPSICRVGDDYYIATSTFEWYPGVQIHHSTRPGELAAGQAPARPRRASSTCAAIPIRGGIWAPCLSYADGLFWLVYTDVKRFDGNFKDAHNYIVTAPAIEGPWSDPVYVNSSRLRPVAVPRRRRPQVVPQHAVEPCLARRRRQPEAPAFAGILLQEYDAEAGKLIGPVKNIFAGTALGLVEGPHLFKRDGWYYLTTAEGGTGYDHAVTMARSRDDRRPLRAASRHAPDHLEGRARRRRCSAPATARSSRRRTARSITRISARGRCRALRRSPLGRETAIQKCVWGDDGWLDSHTAAPVPAVEVEAPPGSPRDRAAERAVDATTSTADACRRFPVAAHAVPRAHLLADRRPGALRLIGRESIGSWFEQALVARRQEHFSLPRRDRARLRPGHLPAGRRPHALLQPPQIPLPRRHPRRRARPRAHDHVLPRRLAGRPPDLPARAADPAPATARSTSPPRSTAPRCSSSIAPAANGLPVGPVLDASVISDEGGRGEHGSFTGAFVGMVAFDTSGAAMPADFSRFPI